MRFETSYTPQHWEFGIGYYKASFYVNFFTDIVESKPSELSFMFGPWTLSIFIGHNVEVIAGPPRTAK